MNKSIILHHYDASPYAEKIRLMFGITGLHWQSLVSPVQPPRPNLDPLTGGYRRIPVLQIGADIFCDTALIAREVAAAAECPRLDPVNASEADKALAEQAEKRAFFAAIGAVPPMRLLGTMLLRFGPVGTFRFIKDRAGMMKGGTVRPAQGDDAKAELKSLVAALDVRLADSSWLGGSEPALVDLACFHPLWLHANCSRRPLDADHRVQDWFQRVADLGHGVREDITREQAFSEAKAADPRPLPTSVDGAPVAVASSVEVAPSDYAVVPVSGRLAAFTDDRIVLARETPEFGTVHVHFPRSGYSMVAV